VVGAGVVGAGVVGVVVDGGVGVGEDGASPLHGTPLKAKSAGAAFVPEYVAWKPNRADAPVASGPFQPTLAAVTAVPVWVTVAFQPLLIRWSPANVQDSVHAVTGAPPLVTCTSVVKPVDHWLAVHCTVHAVAAAEAGPRMTSSPAPTSSATAATIGSDLFRTGSSFPIWERSHTVDHHVLDITRPDPETFTNIDRCER
jgi:hypothetical protein